MLGGKIPNSGRKLAFIKEAAVGRLPQRGWAAPRPTPFVGILYGGWLSACFLKNLDFPKHLITQLGVLKNVAHPAFNNPVMGLIFVKS